MSVSLSKAQAQVAAELERRQRNIEQFFRFLTDDDLVMLADDNQAHPRYDFVIQLCEAIEKRGLDLNSAIKKYQTEE